MKLNPYLAFDGRCREAFEFYERTLSGKITFIQTIGESPLAFSALSQNGAVEMPFQATF